MSKVANYGLIIITVRDLLILCSFPERWNNLVMDASNYVTGLGTLNFNDDVGVILGKEM